MKVKFQRYVALCGVAITTMSLSWSTQAANWADRTQINGFMSARYSVSDDPLFFHGGRTDNGINEDGSFHGTKLGLNITSRVTDRLTVASQLFSSIEEEGYATHLDWAFARYALTDELAVRAGKIKYPVGLVNEFVDVGVTYPWIEAPLVIYSESQSGAQATREAYTGADLLWNRYLGDWSLGGDLFAGQVDLNGMTIKTMKGLTANATWDDAVTLQASWYRGDMMPDDPTSMMGMMMDEKEHSATLVGAKVDWNNIVGYAEWADVSMDVKNMMGVSIMDSKSWYVTLGYRFKGRILPHYTYQQWEQGDGNGHEIATLGVAYTVSPNLVLKLENSTIKTDGAGLFVDDMDMAASPGGDVNMTSIAVDVVF